VKLLILGATGGTGRHAVAAALAAASRGKLDRDDAVVCLITGSGFKDPASVERMTSHADCPTLSWRELEGFILPKK